jgi:hypothetical protein
MAPKPADDQEPLVVRAARRGQYDQILRRVGSVFPLKRREDFRPSWMAVVPPDTPIRDVMIVDEQTQLSLRKNGEAIPPFWRPRDEPADAHDWDPFEWPRRKAR